MTEFRRVLFRSSEPSPIRFGVFELDTRTGELRKHGVRLKLQDQPFQVLQALLERPGELVTREELQARIWANDTFVDFDQSLKTPRILHIKAFLIRRPRHIKCTGYALGTV